MSANSRLGPTTLNPAQALNGGDGGDIRPAPLTRASTLPLEIPSSSSPRAGRSHLSPEDAFKATLPPRRPSEFETHGNGIHDASASANAELRRRSTRPKIESRSRSRRRKRSWKKLLWVKQSCACDHISSNILHIFCRAYTYTYTCTHGFDLVLTGDTLCRSR